MSLTMATPSFGKAKYLKGCIDSVANQSIPTYHSVCFGGNAPEISKPDTCVVYNVTPDPGMVPCWNEAADMATTPFIGFVADDNLIMPDYAEKMVNFLNTYTECDVVFCNQGIINASSEYDAALTEKFNENFGRNKISTGVVSMDKYSFLFHHSAIPVEASVIRKSVWDKYGPFEKNAKGAFDLYFISRLLLDRVKIGFISEPLMRFRIHDEAYTARANKEHLQGSIWVYQKLLESYPSEHTFLSVGLNNYKGRSLRYKMPLIERLKIIKFLIFQKNGIANILKNSIAGILKRT